MKKRKIMPLLLVFLLLVQVIGICSVAYAKGAVKLNRTKLNLTVGNTYTLKLQNYSGTVKWSVSNKSRAQITKKTKNTAVVKAKKTGTVTVRAKAGKKTYTCKITVKAKKPTLSKKSVTIYTGKTYDIRLMNTTKSVKWSTSSKSKATVKKLSKYKARITAKKKGTVKIKAKSGGKTYTCVVKILPYVKTKSASISISGDLTAGNKVKASATVKPSNASNKTVTWKSSNKSIAEVSSSGVITLKKAGTVKISCVTADKVTKSKTITVKAKPTPVKQTEAATANKPAATTTPQPKPVTQTPAQPETTVKVPVTQPATNPPATVTPATEAPATEAPETEPPVTEAPETEAAETEAPETEPPATEEHETEPVTADEGVSQELIEGSSPVNIIGIPDETMAVGESFKLSAEAEDGTELVWESNDPSIASVTADGEVICSGKGLAILNCTTKDGKSGATIAFVVQSDEKPALLEEWEALEQ